MWMFFQRTGLVAGLALTAAMMVTASQVSAAEAEKTNTVMAVSEMCGGCVKKVTKRFDGVKGIAEVRCSIEHQSVTLIPEEGVRLSPRGVWEAMEGIGKTPKKMVCPAGTFTSKPSTVTVHESV